MKIAVVSVFAFSTALAAAGAKPIEITVRPTGGDATAAKAIKGLKPDVVRQTSLSR